MQDERLPSEPIVVTDVYADDIFRTEIIGTNIRLVFFCWRLAKDGVTWTKTISDIAMILPARAFRFPISAWPHVSLAGDTMGAASCKTSLQ